MKTLDIGVDLDGVGYNIHASLAPYARTHGYPLASEATWNRIDPDTGLHAGHTGWGIAGHKEFFALCTRAVTDGALYSKGAPFPGFVAMMRELAADGHRLHIITARPALGGRVERATRAWLAEWAVPFHRLVLSGKKTGWGAEVFIEDSAFRYDELLDDGTTVPYLVTRPWNRGVQVENRVDDLGQFVGEVRRRVSPRAAAEGHVGGVSELVFRAPK